MTGTRVGAEPSNDDKRRRSRCSGAALRLAVGLILTTASSSAWALARGIRVRNCESCHINAGAQVNIAATPAVFSPGDEVTFTVTLTRDGLNAGGMYLRNFFEQGELRTLAGEGLASFGTELTHTSPKAGSDSVAFRFAWRAPTTPGSVRFDVWAVTANGDNTPNGDVATSGSFSWVYGCEGQTLFEDLDGDGFGTTLFTPLLACVGPVPAGFSEFDTDCNENDGAVNPNAIELCNTEDDDCDAIVDEDSVPIALWPDLDGDGFYESTDENPVLGCLAPGLSSRAGDCSPNDSAIGPGQPELCNDIDDDCDGEIDERVRPVCGVGLCGRTSSTCSVLDCTPGTPSEERCNTFDDDCNGMTDEGDLCDAGESCVSGTCVVTEGEGSASAGAPASPQGASGTTATDIPASGTAGTRGELGPRDAPSTGASSQGDAAAFAGQGCSMARAERGQSLQPRSWVWGLGALGLLLGRRAFARGDRQNVA